MPITFPPDRFYGAELSAMCVPDLLGTQGTFLLFTTRPAGDALQGRRPARSGHARRAIAIDTTIKGPENLFLGGDRRRSKCRCGSTIDRATQVVRASI